MVIIMLKKFISLFICIICLTGCNTKEMSNNNVDTTNETHEIVEEEYTLSDNETNKINLLLSSIPYSLENFSFNDLDNQQKLQIIFNIISNNEYMGDGSKLSLTKENLLMITQKYFGENATIDMENLYSPYDNDILYSYNAKTESFVQSPYGHGVGDLNSYNTVIKATKKEDKVLVYFTRMYTAYLDTGEEPKELYKTIEDAQNQTNPIITKLSKNEFCSYDYYDFLECDFDKIATKNQDLFNTYLLTFTMSNENIYLDSLTITE